MGVEEQMAGLAFCMIESLLKLKAYDNLEVSLLELRSLWWYQQKAKLKSCQHCDSPLQSFGWGHLFACLSPKALSKKDSIQGQFFSLPFSSPCVLILLLGMRVISHSITKVLWWWWFGNQLCKPNPKGTMEDTKSCIQGQFFLFHLVHRVVILLAWMRVIGQSIARVSWWWWFGNPSTVQTKSFSKRLGRTHSMNIMIHED